MFIVKGVLLLLVLFSGTVTLADLEKEVDGLTPEGAHRIMAKLKAKAVEPLPSYLFTELSASISLGANFAEPNKFESSLNAAFADKFGPMGYFDISLMWKVSDYWRMGLGFGGVKKKLSREIATDVFQDVALNVRYVHLALGHTSGFSEKWVFFPSLGFGVVGVRAEIETSSDSAASSVGAISTHSYQYQGGGVSGKVATAFLYKMNPVLSIGLEAGYLAANVTKLKRSGQTEISTPEEVNISGGLFALKISYNL